MAGRKNEIITPASERTPLLGEVTGRPSQHSQTDYDDTIPSEELLGDHFGETLSKCVSYASTLGLQPQSQTEGLLQGHRRGSIHKGPNVLDEEAIDVYEDRKDETSSPYRGVSVRKFWVIFLTIMSTHFLSCFDGTIMASSHPVITSYFQSANSASWLSTAFMLTSTAFQPLFGRLSDSLGRKPPYIFCSAVFLIATVWCACAQSMMSFILARALCGLGAGGCMTMGSIITSDLVPIEIRGIYQSYINIVYGVASALGAATGGLIADSLGWRWEFGIQVPALAACLLTAIITVPSDLGLGYGVEQLKLWDALKVFDYKGSLLLTSSITCLILGVNLGGNIYSWSHPLVIGALAIFCVTFPSFIYVESHAKRPIMPLKLVRYYPRCGIILSNFLTAIVINGVMFNMPLYFQAVLLDSATRSGLRLVIPSAVASVFGTATGFIINWSGRMRWSITWGGSLVLIGLICLSSMTKGLPEWAYIIFMVPTFVGQGFLFPGSFISALAVSDQSEQAVVTSTLILWRSMGSILGVATSSLVVQNSLLAFLYEFVRGPEKEEVIETVRGSIEAIAKLPQPYQEQVISSYAAALRVTFMAMAVVSTIAWVMGQRVKLPRLSKKH